MAAEADGALIAAAVNALESLLDVAEAAQRVNRFAGNPDAMAGFDLACYALDKALAKLEAPT